MINNAQGQGNSSNNGSPKDKATIHGLPWSKCIIERKNQDQMSAIGCVVRSTAYIPSPHDTPRTITACKAPTHNLSYNFTWRNSPPAVINVLETSNVVGITIDSKEGGGLWLR